MLGTTTLTETVEPRKLIESPHFVNLKGVKVSRESKQELP